MVTETTMPSLAQHNETESMWHILLNCQTTSNGAIWDQVIWMWQHEPAWPEISLGTILGVGSISLLDEDPMRNDANHKRKARRKGKMRLLQILISEVSHLIWVLRCEQVIHRRQHTPKEVKSRWLKAIRNRWAIDIVIAEKIKRSKKLQRLAQATWEGVQIENHP